MTGKVAVLVGLCLLVGVACEGETADWRAFEGTDVYGRAWTVFQWKATGQERGRCRQKPGADEDFDFCKARASQMVSGCVVGSDPIWCQGQPAPVPIAISNY